MAIGRRLLFASHYPPLFFIEYWAILGSDKVPDHSKCISSLKDFKHVMALSNSPR